MTTKKSTSILPSDSTSDSTTVPKIHRAILRSAADSWEWFETPREHITVQTAAREIPAALDQVERRVEATGLPAVGFLCYEAAAAYGLATHQPRARSLPLLAFTLFEHPREGRAVPIPGGVGYTHDEWQPALDAEEYGHAIDSIHAYLRAGETYQVNFTFPMSTTFEGNSEACFFDICNAQNGAYAAYLALSDGHAVLSASPELFLERRGDRISARPMKGTAPRGRTTGEDRAEAEQLRSSPKERAENLMITDMIRNDLGRIAVPGSVRVPELFVVEHYPRVLQMISRVEARSGVSLAELMAATFPCASITGAPKHRTMELIRELEPAPRGIYTGVIGVVRPGRNVRFNVAIRTVVVDEHRGTAVFGVGSGIVWDSRADQEYRECATKASILGKPVPSFELLETVRWNRDRGITLFEGHLRRLRDSAHYFGLALDEAALTHARLHSLITAEVDRVAPPEPGPEPDTAFESDDRGVRILVGSSIRIESFTLGGSKGRNGELSRDITAPQDLRELAVRTLMVDPLPVPEDTVWLYHKTSRRDRYDPGPARAAGAEDRLLHNAAGHLTESCIANLLVLRRTGGTAYLATPPVEDGLLPGVFRDYLLHPPAGFTPWTPEGAPIRVESVPLSVLQEVHDGEATLYLVNSVRGWMRGVLIETAGTTDTRLVSG